MNYPLKTLYGLLNNQVLEQPKLEWWLLKYSDLYIQKSSSRILTNDNPRSSVEKLPCSIKPTSEKVFIELYEQLDWISRLIRMETVFKKEVEKYNQIKNSKLMVNAWYSRNLKFTSNKFLLFSYDALDLNKNDLFISIFWSYNVHIKVKRDELKHFEKFMLEIHNIYNEIN